MMYFITGLPGGGKSLFTLKTVNDRATKEGRAVYYYGIPDLTLPWFQLDKPEEWHLLPAGSIIVIDECQKVFPPRSSGSKPPTHVSEFETHRHKGYDIYLISQHPSLVDNHIKRLCGKHYHVIRSFGLQRADVFEMQSVQEPNNSNLKQAVRHKFSYPKEVFTWYKSSEVHTHKRHLPSKLLLVPLLLVVVVGSSWWSYHTMVEKHAKKPDPSPAGSAAAAPGGLLNPPAANRPMTTAEYAAAYRPRIPDLEYTAPAYDEVTKPVRAPVPAACVASEKRCQCYSQQATRLDVAESTCKQLVERGFFHSFDSLPAAAEIRSASPVPLQANGPVAGSDRVAMN